MEGLILAAGKGSRLSGEASSGICKALVKVNDKPLILYSLENLLRLGIEKATIVIGKNHGAVPSFLGQSYKSVALQYVVQEEPAGLVNAIMCAKDVMREDFVLQLSDEIFLHSKIDRSLFAQNRGLDFFVGYTPDCAEKIKCNFSIETDETLQILHCTEKPKQVINNRKGTGFCFFSGACYDLLIQNYDEQMNMPRDLCDFINLLVVHGKKGRAIQIAEEEINVNTPDDLLYAKQRLKQEGDFE